MIKAENLVKTYGNFKLNLSMELPSGRVSGIVGRNGAGKTTAIKAMLGLIRPDSGKIYTLGKEAMLLSSADKCQIGVALSNSGFSSYLTVKDICAILKGMYPSFDENGFQEQCRKSELPFDKPLKSFSTGMNAKLKTLVACSHGAKLLILDEPTAGLDVIARNEVLNMLRNYLAEDSERSMLISSHISSDLEGICDDIYMIHNGQIILHEDTDVILDRYAVLKMSDDVYKKIDRQYLIKVRQERYGWSCFTNQKQFYAENCPEAVIEDCSIDDMILMMLGDEN